MTLSGLEPELCEPFGWGGDDADEGFAGGFGGAEDSVHQSLAHAVASLIRGYRRRNQGQGGCVFDRAPAGPHVTYDLLVVSKSDNGHLGNSGFVGLDPVKEVFGVDGGEKVAEGCGVAGLLASDDHRSSVKE